jgi:hypothetical protein
MGDLQSVREQLRRQLNPDWSARDRKSLQMSIPDHAADLQHHLVRCGPTNLAGQDQAVNGIWHA